MPKIDRMSAAYFEAVSAQVGRVVHAAAYLDDEICTLITEMLELNDDQENALVRPQSTATKIETLRRISVHLFDDDAGRRISTLCTKIRQTMEVRNALIHGVPSDDGGKLGFVSWVGKNRMAPNVDDWPVEKICELVGQLFAHMDAITDLRREFAESSPTPDPRQQELP